VESPASPTTGFDPPAFLPEREVRYALVLYGGVSLAIYINGVVQEFFRLVRATAPESPLSTDVGLHRAWFPLQAGNRGRAPALKGSERVYRRLGQLLPGGDDAAADAPIRTRFVVDILSGTSAGGINGIFLAKALANQQEIDGLRDLWVDEGDIADLLNDGRSYKDLAEGLKPQKPPRSLLNGYRLLVRALEALDGMEGTEQRPETDKSPSYAEQVDLTVTTTDLQGLRMPVKLYDDVVHEKRHKNVFRFAYWTKEATGADRNDFKAVNNGMLAFTARCTSSFPFAFEPMVLDDLADVLPPEQFDREGQPWRQFFRDYIRMGAKDYRRYAFADGGYLDNKPFSHATDQLARRRADVPVDRKLIYIEPDPSPALPPDVRAAAARERPGVFENVIAAVTGIPRTETIREDVDAVVRRSRTVARLREVTDRVIDEAATSVMMGGAEPTTLRSDPESATYHALRRRVVVDELADVVARVADIPEGSDGQYALQLVASVWAAGIENKQLFDRYDLGFELRRLNFVQRRIDDLLRGVGGPSEVARDLGLWTLDAQTGRLRQVKMALNEIFVELRWRGRGARRPERTADELEADRIMDVPQQGTTDPELFRAVADAVAETGLTEDALVAEVLDPGDGRVRSDREARGRAETLAAARRDQLDAVGDALAAVFDLPLRAARAGAALVLAGDPGEDASAESEARMWLLRPGEPESDQPELLRGLDELPAQVREVLRYFYEAFNRIDALLLPLTYPDLGEVNPVDVIRISSQDARSLVDEQRTRKRKLAGTSVHHFGGFLDEGFRVNDILWGRLDGAERIIGTALPPNHTKKDLFVEAAHLAIIGESLLGGTRDAWVTAAIKDKSPAASRTGASLDDLRELLGDEWTDQRLGEALAVRAYLATEFTAPMQMDRRKMLDVIGRGTTITSDVVGAASDATKSFRKPLFWAGRIGRLLTGLAAVASRRKVGELPRLVFGNIAAIAILVVAPVLILLGILGLEGAQRAGWTIGVVALVSVAAVWVTTAWIGPPSRKPGASRWRKRAVRASTGFVVVVIVLLAAVGGLYLVDKIADRF
jgi:patatin-related protein